MSNLNKTLSKLPTIVVVVSGGCVQGVHSTISGVTYAIHDYDDLRESGESPTVSDEDLAARYIEARLFAEVA